MKKNLSGFFLIFLIIFLIGCEKKEGKNVEKKDIIYHLVELSNSKDIYNESDLKKLDINYELVMSTVANNATLKIGDYTINLKYNNNDFIDETSEEVFNYEKIDNRVTINYNGEKMVFEEN